MYSGILREGFGISRRAPEELPKNLKSNHEPIWYEYRMHIEDIKEKMWKISKEKPKS
jgi:hypothetical protein